jgi:hypothetical protein
MSETAQSVAQKLSEYVESQAEELGQSPDVEVTTCEEDGHWKIYWEGGVENWAYAVSAGLGVYGINKDVLPVDPMDVSDVWVEPEYSFVLEIGDY